MRGTRDGLERRGILWERKYEEERKRHLHQNAREESIRVFVLSSAYNITHRRQPSYESPKGISSKSAYVAIVSISKAARNEIIYRKALEAQGAEELYKVEACDRIVSYMKRRYIYMTWRVGRHWWYCCRPLQRLASIGHFEITPILLSAFPPSNADCGGTRHCVARRRGGASAATYSRWSPVIRRCGGVELLIAYLINISNHQSTVAVVLKSHKQWHQKSLSGCRNQMYCLFVACILITKSCILVRRRVNASKARLERYRMRY